MHSEGGVWGMLRGVRGVFVSVVVLGIGGLGCMGVGRV